MRTVVIATGDLMFESRLRQALPGAAVRVVRPGSEVPDGADLAVVDLNREPEAGVELIARFRRDWPTLPILGFCHHGEREVRTSAMAAGATEVVTNGSVPEAAARLAGIEATSPRR